MKKFLLFLTVAMTVAAVAHAATAYRYHDSVTTIRGDAVGAASVTVYVAKTTTKADLYLYGTTTGPTKSNPTYTDGYGRFFFYVAPGLYDLVISGTNVTTYTVEDVRVFSDAGYTFNVLDYGAVAGDAASDSTAIKAAIAAADSNNTVYFPPGVYIASRLNVTKPGVTFLMAGGAVISSPDTNRSLVIANGARGFRIIGGRLTGPGKANADAGCYGVLLIGSSYVQLDGVEIDGFYHGVRPSDTPGSAENNSFRNLYVHDCAFAGIFPKDGDIVYNCRFENIGTLGTHHGLYINTAIARGMSVASNHYEGVSGSAVHIYSPADIAFRNITMTNESMYDCGRGYTIDIMDGRNITISGAAIAACDSIDSNTGQGVHINSSGTLRGLKVEANIAGCDSHGFSAQTSNTENCFVSVVVDSCGYDGANLSVDDWSGQIVSGYNGRRGVYLNGANRNNFIIRARANDGLGLYLSGNSRYNLIDVYSSSNVSHGVGAAAGSDSNVIRGISGANAGSELNDSGTGNTTTGLVQW